jgi:hypothetical protein
VTSIHSFQDFSEVPGDVLAAEFYDQRSQLMWSLSRQLTRVTDQMGGRPPQTMDSAMMRSRSSLLRCQDLKAMRQGGRDERSQEAAGSIVIGQSKFVDEACLGEGILRTERALMVMSSPTSGRTFCGVCRGAIKRPRHRGEGE